jgi:hypothetical protein
MGTMIARGWIDTFEVRRALYAAAESNGQVKEFGLDHFDKTFKDGIAHGILTPHSDLPNDPAPATPPAAEADDRPPPSGPVAGHSKAGLMPHEFGVFVRSAGQLIRAQAAAKKAGVAFKVLDENVETTSGHLSIGTMHLAKGLEFRAVVVMACDDEVIPLQERIETVGDEADLQEVYDTERHLLYVACTRARDHLLITGVEPVSEFFGRLYEVRKHGG